MLQALPLNKSGSFINIIDWQSFKDRLVDEFGSVDIFGCKANAVFNLTELLTRKDGKVCGAVIEFRKENREGWSDKNTAPGPGSQSHEDFFFTTFIFLRMLKDRIPLYSYRDIISYKIE